MTGRPCRDVAAGTGPVSRSLRVGRRPAILSLLFLLLPGVIPGHASAGEGGIPSRWGILSGYGSTHPGLGDTSQEVRVVDVVLRHRTTVKQTGRGWYRGSHDLILELPVSLLVEPEGRPPIFGLNFLACWTLRSWDMVWPHLFGGGGPVYTEAGIAEMSTRWNGNYQAGCGVRFFPERTCQPVLEYRFHHISNGGREKPNDPLNSSKVLVGMEYRF